MTTDERIEKIENQLARMRWFNRCLITCIVLSLGVWFILRTFGSETAWAQSGAKVIRANRFIVEDKNGKPRAGLTVLKDDGPGLSLMDENGKTRALLAVFSLGPTLSLHDENGKLRATLVGGKRPHFTLYHENGKPCVELETTSVVPSWILSGENGKARTLAEAKAGPGLVLSDENGKTIWSAP